MTDQNVFIEEAKKRLKKIYPDIEYDFSISKYMGHMKPISFICPIHGIQTKRADQLWAGEGCKLCGIERRQTVQRKKEIYKTKYINKNGYVTIIIPRKEWDELFEFKTGQRIVKDKNNIECCLVLEHVYIIAKEYVKNNPDKKFKNNKNWTVHHKDGNRANNNIKNLEIKYSGHGPGHTIEETIKSSIGIFLENSSIEELKKLIPELI